MKEGKLPKRQYTQEFKGEAVRLAASVGGHEAVGHETLPELPDAHSAPSM